MRKKGFILMICLCMALLSYIPVNAKETIGDNIAINAEVKSVFSEYKWYDCEGGAMGLVQILKNDTGNRVYIMGINLVDAMGDMGIEKKSIKMKSYQIYDNGSYAVFTLEYVDFGKTKTKTYTVYAT